MDIPGQCPEYYRDKSAADSIKNTAAFIEAVKALEGNEKGFVLPSVNPRFVPTCSTEALRGLGELAQRYGFHVQTHCSEGDWEHNHVIDRLKKHDAFALDEMILVTRRTVLLWPIAHYQISILPNAVFPLKKALDKNLHVGLGTDIAGGRSPSVLDTCRHAVVASRVPEDGVDPNNDPEVQAGWKDSRANFIETFWLATTQGGVTLDLNIGKFAPGYAFNGLVMDVDAPGSNVRVFNSEDSLGDIFQKIVYNATNTNIMQTWVNGKLVHRR
ncbi:Amidohydrolase-related [Trypanosoma melophagium]|uniref:Amidohydrolase-related n=1 Tax=Trypanosoma melophagium TaxID=715481 RepID=UPI00351A6E6D|nr:Amidohydrolase-related [Trypanosoma melophagium]